jgi:hypothetical protein
MRDVFKRGSKCLGYRLTDNGVLILVRNEHAPTDYETYEVYDLYVREYLEYSDGYNWDGLWMCLVDVWKMTDELTLLVFEQP